MGQNDGMDKIDGGCCWSQPVDFFEQGTTVWDTTCGHSFMLNEGSPTDNHMSYCCYCGQRIQQVH